VKDRVRKLGQSLKPYGRQYAVWPDQIKGHLQEQHKVSRKQADFVGEQIRSWAGLLQYPSKLKVPGGVPRPVAQLAVYTNGLLCQLDLGQCSRIFRSSKSLKKHWRIDHGWSASGRQGQPSQTRQKSMQAQIVTKQPTRTPCSS
jgi:uncharacterized C2H2 Zn-finger protein